MGRAFHHLGLSHLAVASYEKVLQLEESRGINQSGRGNAPPPLPPRATTASTDAATSAAAVPISTGSGGGAPLCEDGAESLRYEAGHNLALICCAAAPETSQDKSCGPCLFDATVLIAGALDLAARGACPAALKE
eukprot:CAMPEP_0174731176 /NCGR_PEP_ID=MMETSP1094-20130205/57044_1 /TAXON_ID=156173 /ORGANISM="Chrysochromulina brevifilum, Strain UTEX LB 985" /LENGTH=134 /DNA_ID=CAMNT_0015933525 /DNA_START=80 /DNA_END=485 /DNA_ORIENTATION=+